MKILVILIFILTSLTPSWADNDEIVAENIEIVKKSARAGWPETMCLLHWWLPPMPSIATKAEQN
jgi:hypothetical protein